jgi:phosphoglycolate phosphatase-like HAD superfamily hydrolase
LTKKEHILQKILEKYIKENLSSILFIGDRNEDVIAANSVNIPVIYAEWGYGEKDKLGNTLAKIKSPKELLKYLKNYQLISE